jgi:hypothetical protein
MNFQCQRGCPLIIYLLQEHALPLFGTANLLKLVGKNSLIMNNPDLMLRESILTKNDAITQHK